MNALNLSASRRRNQVVILRSFDLSKSKTRRSIGSADVLRFLRKALSLAFCQTATMAVLAVVALAMWWHNITITDTLEAQTAVGFDCLLAMPWLVAMFVNLDSKKGGAQ